MSSWPWDFLSTEKRRTEIGDTAAFLFCGVNVNGNWIFFRRNFYFRTIKLGRSQQFRSIASEQRLYQVFTKM